MSAQAVEGVLTRAMGDAKFAEMLFSNTDKALKGIDLTKEEMTGLQSMTRKDFQQYAKASPEERKSFGTMNHNEATLGVRG